MVGDNSDVFYPACSIKGFASVGGHLDQLTLANVPTFITNTINAGAVTLVVYCETRALNSANTPIRVTGMANATTVQLATPVNNAVLITEPLVFIDANQANLLRRWKYFLQHDLLDQNHGVIQAAIHQLLADTSFDH